MPSSPPSAAQPPLQPPFSSVLVDTANATDDELLHLIENARAAVERARDATESFTGRRREDQEEENPSDAAAESLFERHSNRRDMELDWDERDTERRARNLLDRLQRNRPAEPLGEPDSEEEDDELMMGNERYPVGQVHHIGGGYSRVAGGALSAGDMFGLPTFGGIIEGSDEDDDDDSYVETGEEAIFGVGFDDGDGVDEELEEAAWRYEQEMRRHEDSSTTDSTAPRLTSIWPGLLGEQPLNPSRPAAPPTVTSASKPSNNLSPLDPSSSTSFTSFLTPGATFIGEQVTSRAGNPRAQAERNRTRNLQPSSRLRRPAPGELDSTSSSAQNTTAHPAFAPFPTLSSSQSSPPGQGLSSSSSSSSAFHRSADPAQAFLLGPLRPTSSSSSSNPTNPSTDRPSSSRYAPYSSSHAAAVVSPSTSSASTPLQAPIPPNLTPVERARISIARSTNPAARTNPESWREVGRELMGRSRGEGSTNEGAATTGRVGPGSDEERWGVQVVIHSYDPSTASLTGLMNAYGIRSTHRNPSTHPARVTTFFSATILQPLKSGLFLSPSLTGSGGNSAEGLKVSQSTEAESWIQLGPFKGVSKNEFLRLAKDRHWVEDMASGWVLMRWKEREFINVKANESTLSINGFYFVALNRSTGVIEGLYSDPISATPYQRLDLSPSSPDGAFSLATYEMC